MGRWLLGTTSSETLLINILCLVVSICWWLSQDICCSDNEDQVTKHIRFGSTEGWLAMALSQMLDR